jgi:hypothetical protein
MKRYRYAEYSRMPMGKREHVDAVNRALDAATSDLAYTVARRVAEELRYLAWSMRHPGLSFGISIEQRASLDAGCAIKVALMAREGRRIAGSDWAWSDALSRAMRHTAEESARAA